MDYLGFDLRLAEWNADAHTGMAEVLQSPVGEGPRHAFVLDLDVDTCARRVARTPSLAADLGRRLTESIFSRDSLALWHASYQVARERGRGLRLRLHIDSWNLSRMPWELLYDPRQNDFLVFDPMVSLVRYIRLHAALPALRQARSLRVLAVVASPVDQPRLDAEREVGFLQEALFDLVETGQIEVIVHEHATHDSLHIALLEHRPDVMHFIGHGVYDPEQLQGYLVLEDVNRRSSLLGATQAARMIRRYGTNLVLLNACETATGAWAGLAPALVRAEIPAVVAMQWPIEDGAAIRFSRGFYRALSRGSSVDECVAEGRLGASATSHDPNDWAAPVLFLRSLSGQLWTNEATGYGHRPWATADDDAQSGAALRNPLSVPQGVDPDLFHFKTWGPLLPASDADFLVDRPELRRALRIAQQPSVTQYIAFLSARQTGKTTLIFQLISLLKDHYACVFLDLSVLRNQDAQSCFRFLTFRLISEFRALLGDDFRFPEGPPIEGSVEFLEFLRQLADAVPMPRIIILMDEVGALSSAASDSFFNALRTVFIQGRGLSAQLSKYLFIFSGAVDLYTLTFGSNSPLNICEKLFLRDFELADVEQVVHQFEILGAAVAEDASERIFGLTGGHPYLTMRLCALMEHAQAQTIGAEEIDAAAAQILIEDDNIRHIIRELERHPAERRRLRSILVEGREIPFSRNDAVLASLEMIGAIRGTQPCQVRNLLYEHALRDYYASREESGQAGGLAEASVTTEESEALYAQLRMLRLQTLGADGRYKGGKAWETFAAALFSTIPAFSVYPDVHTNTAQLDLVLAISNVAPNGGYWNAYQPAILVECRNVGDGAPENLVPEILDDARLHNIKLVFLMTAGGEASLSDLQEQYCGASDDTCLLLIDDREIERILEEQADLDTFLRSKVLAARLRRI